jgi:hypothetical protein
MFGAKRLSGNRNTESVVVLTPNIRLRLFAYATISLSTKEPHKARQNRLQYRLRDLRRPDPLPRAKRASSQEISPLLGPGAVGVDATLDFGDPLVMAVNHADNRDRASDQDGADGNQQRAQAEDGIDQSVHALSSSQFPVLSSQ